MEEVLHIVFDDQEEAVIKFTLRDAIGSKEVADRSRILGDRLRNGSLGDTLTINCLCETVEKYVEEMVKLGWEVPENTVDNLQILCMEKQLA